METRQVENVMPQPENQTAIPPTEIRYVLYSSTRGVYLGKDIWSKDKEAKSIIKAITMAHLKLDRSGQVEDAVAHQCMPDLPDNYASKIRIAESGLPRW